MTAPKQQAEQLRGAADAQTRKAKPKRALATLRGDGRRVKTPRLSPRLAGEVPLGGLQGGRAGAAAAEGLLPPGWGLLHPLRPLHPLALGLSAF